MTKGIGYFLGNLIARAATHGLNESSRREPAKPDDSSDSDDASDSDDSSDSYLSSDLDNSSDTDTSSDLEDSSDFDDSSDTDTSSDLEDSSDFDDSSDTDSSSDLEDSSDFDDSSDDEDDFNPNQLPVHTEEYRKRFKDKKSYGDTFDELGIDLPDGSELICPVSQMVMNIPVLANGRSYDLTTLLRCPKNGRNNIKDPILGPKYAFPLSHIQPDYNAKAAIEKTIEAKRAALQAERKDEEKAEPKNDATPLPVKRSRFK